MYIFLDGIVMFDNPCGERHSFPSLAGVGYYPTPAKEGSEWRSPQGLSNITIPSEK
jgi:hypothetical protein